MRLTKTVKFLTALLVCAIAVSANAQTTKKHHGIQGPKLIPQTATTKTYTYQVKGKTYTTKSSKNAKNYSKEGIASYYHKKFTGRRTASGEPYHPTRYTAAHKTLPLNSYALVTNLRNNRKVIVRINDRGPFSNKRIIDLSYASAKEIGIIGSGLGKVRIEALHVDRSGKISGPAAEVLAKAAKTKEVAQRIDNAAISHQAKEKASKQSGYKLRMLNVSNKKQAEQLIDRLALENVKAEISQNGSKYDIHFGPLKNQNEINQLKAQLKKLNQAKQLIVYSDN
ncbi:septal ring lytic transglycosylase RlpA family lipoprotein [Actinobacillus seminis]|uniref:Endolytic peptidoglycan transglycosylase RlpA n=1 Tax=Actinobacillus seminis TaxID=722 RepID=A0A263HDH5_9PAST|nr:septal ring lytic transglycosylase RlpA family protein [Actinobacillus seminis]OZN25490.1 septal ring lytic transglycosylase RlpA family lipoprotein [Actinobacillus seminis]SUU37952.1 rare lipoprotein A [Actinobacillus seminis]